MIRLRVLLHRRPNDLDLAQIALSPVARLRAVVQVADLVVVHAHQLRAHAVGRQPVAARDAHLLADRGAVHRPCALHALVAVDHRQVRVQLGRQHEQVEVDPVHPAAMHQRLVRPGPRRARHRPQPCTRVLDPRAHHHVLQRERNPHQVVCLQLRRRDHIVVRRVHHHRRHARRMRLHVLLVDAVHNLVLLSVQVHQLHVVLRRQLVVTVVGESLHRRPVCRRLGNHHIGLANRLQELQYSFQIVRARRAQRHIDDHVVRLQHHALIANRRCNLLLERRQRIERNLRAVVPSRQRHPAWPTVRRSHGRDWRRHGHRHLRRCNRCRATKHRRLQKISAGVLAIHTHALHLVDFSESIRRPTPRRTHPTQDYVTQIT